MRTIALVMIALLIACAPIPTTTPTGQATVEPVEVPAENLLPQEPAPEPELPPQDIFFTVDAVEGDLIELSPEAIDPDGDTISFTFTEPFSPEGQWQTQIGDEGTYHVAVAANDGKSTTTETIKVVVARANRPPVVECQPIKVKEGDVIDLHESCLVFDEDDEEIVVTYGGWMSGWKYTTTFDDAGEYTVVVTASDKEDGKQNHVVKRDVPITVENVNRAPVFSDDFPTKVVGTENDVLTLPIVGITDPDGDKVTLTYSDPFGDDGVWKTALGDAGTYTVDVVATDGVTSTKQTIEVQLGLLNTAPSLKRIPDITVDEGETVRLAIDATDREGDELTVVISGWMTRDVYKTTYEDAGSYTVKVTVADGELETSQVVQVTVQDVNRPPVFVTPA